MSTDDEDTAAAGSKGKREAKRRKKVADEPKGPNKTPDSPEPDVAGKWTVPDGATLLAINKLAAVRSNKAGVTDRRQRSGMTGDLPPKGW